MKFFAIEITRRIFLPVRAVSKVEGFTVSLEKKPGTLLTFESENEEPPKPASQDTYYEVVVRSTGENPEYPEDNKPMIGRFTVGLKKELSGMIGGTGYISRGERFTGFEVVEEYDDGRPKQGFVGRQMPAHHAVMLRAHFTTTDGKTTQMAMGRWVRKSERERPEWQAAASSPVMYM